MGRGGRSPLLSSGAKEKIFPHKIRVEEREGVDKNNKKRYTKEGDPAQSGVPHLNLSMHFFLQLNISFLVSHEALIVLQQKTQKTHQIAYQCVSEITIIPLIL